MKSLNLASYSGWTSIGGYRADAEYYRPEHREFFASLTAIPHRRLSQIAKMRRPQYRTTTAHEPGKLPNGIKFLSPTEVLNQWVDWSIVREVAPDAWNEYPAGQATKGDLLLEVKGDATKVYLLDDTFPKKAMVSGSFQQIRLKDGNEEWFVYAVFLSGVWQRQRQRLQSNINIKYVDKEALKTVTLPWPSNSIRMSIGHKVQACVRLRASADVAKQTLHSIFPEFVLRPLPFTGQWLRNRLLDTERLEAQYYEPHFLEMMQVIESLPCKVVSLQQLVASMRHGASVTGVDTVGGRIRFIRGMEVGPNRISTDDVVCLSDDVIAELASSHFIKGGDLLVTRSGTVGSCAVAREKEIGVAFGSFVIAVQINKEDGITPEYVAAFLNSPLGQAQFRREENGAVQMNINNGELRRIRIPLFTADIREAVVKEVNAYNSNLDRAEQLVRSATTEVENLIDGKLDEAACIAEGRKLAEEFGLEVP